MRILEDAVRSSCNREICSSGPLRGTLCRVQSTSGVNYYGSDSDLDLLVSFEVLPDLITFTALQQELEDVFGMRVDLVLHDSLMPRLRPQILREAVELPNALTAETLRKSERGEDVHEAKDADDLFRQLGI